VDPGLAQSDLDPDAWQQTATGLSVYQNDARETSGLGLVVGSSSWPFLSLRGGVENGGYGALVGPVGIELGAVIIPGEATPVLTLEDVSWARSAMVFDTGSSFQIWVSRLSPAVAVESTAKSLRLFTGAVSGDTFDGTSVTARSDAPSYPKYVAYMSSGGIQTQMLSTSDLSLGALSENWILVWYGGNSHFVESKVPTSYSGSGWATATLPHSLAYQADAPMLLVFGNSPQSIKQAAEGGIELAFGSELDALAVLPLLGRDHPEASETESWGAGLPSWVAERAQWWQRHLCQYPINVREDYVYESGTDTVAITESFEYLMLCSGGTTFAPLPPALGISREALQTTFSGTVVNSRLATEFGPLLGIENTSSYVWRVSGLGTHIVGRRVALGQGTVPPEVEAALEDEVDALLGSGHLAPWIFSDSIPSRDIRGDIYWHSPADVLYHLVEIGEVIDGDRRFQLQTYLEQEQSAYPAETVANLPLEVGRDRGPFALHGSEAQSDWQQHRSELFLTDVPLYSYYGLSRYYDFTGASITADVWQKAVDTLDRDSREQDWATFYWFSGFDDHRVSVINANRHLAGLIGFIRLASAIGDADAEALGRCLFAKAAVLRFSQAQYPRYLYAAELVDLPAPDWQVDTTAGKWAGFIFNYEWMNGYDDARQVVTLDQFGVTLRDHSGFGPCDSGACSPYLVAYRDMVPEVTRLLDDYVGADGAVYLDKAEAIFPHWYAAYGEGMLSLEHNLSHPVDSFQLFMTYAITKDVNPDTLARYADVSWLETGDLFYMQKLAEVIRLYEGSGWTQSIALRGTPGVQEIGLQWSVYTSLPSDSTWRIDYLGPSDNQPSPITGLSQSLREYTLTELTSFAPYIVTLTAMQGTAALVSSNSIHVVARGALYLPFTIMEN